MKKVKAFLKDRTEVANWQLLLVMIILTLNILEDIFK